MTETHQAQNGSSVLRLYAGATVVFAMFTSFWLFQCPRYQLAGETKAIEASHIIAGARLSYSVDHPLIDSVWFWGFELIGATVIYSITMFAHASFIAIRCQAEAPDLETADASSAE